MKDKKRQNGRGDASDIGVIRVLSNPGPDAEDRLRRLMSLMIRYATGDGRAAQGDKPTSEPHAKCHDEADA